MRLFTDDKEKMADFYKISKGEFLKSYSYVTEKEYDLVNRADSEFNSGMEYFWDSINASTYEDEDMTEDERELIFEGITDLMKR